MRMGRLGALVAGAAAVMLLGAGCMADDAPAPDDDVDAGSHQPLGSIELPETSGMLQRDFTIHIAGMGSTFVGGIDLTQDGFGTVEAGGQPMNAVVYERQYGFEDTLMQTLAVSEGRWYLFWFYCNNGDLTKVYFEGTDGPLGYEDATGNCIDVSQPSQAQVEFPAVDMPWPELVDGFTITGPDVNVPEGEPGTLTLGETTYTVLPFSSVDCTACATTDDRPGWFELHVILWDESSRSACFAIFYFDESRPDQVFLTYSLSLPRLSDPAGDSLLQATWTTPATP